jgi:hypothetical protein
MSSPIPDRPGAPEMKGNGGCSARGTEQFAATGENTRRHTPSANSFDRFDRPPEKLSTVLHRR